MEARASSNGLGPGSGEIYKRDNLLGPEAVEACFYGTSWCTRCRECARGAPGSHRYGAAASGVVVLVARERGTEVRGRAQISLRARVHGSRENREPPARQKRPREPREGPGRHAALTISRVAPLTLH